MAITKPLSRGMVQPLSRDGGGWPTSSGSYLAGTGVQLLHQKQTASIFIHHSVMQCKVKIHKYLICSLIQTSRRRKCQPECIPGEQQGTQDDQRYVSVDVSAPCQPWCKDQHSEPSSRLVVQTDHMTGPLLFSKLQWLVPRENVLGVCNVGFLIPHICKQISKEYRATHRSCTR